jgi:flagellar biosynthesis protein FliR
LDQTFLSTIPGFLPPLELLARLDPTLLPAGLSYSFLLVFARLGSAMMLLPGFGEMWVSPRVRLAFALTLSLVILPLVNESLPPLPGSHAMAALQLGSEVLIGLFIALCIRITVAAVITTGSVIASQAGLANALQGGLVTPDASTILGSFLGITVIAFMVNSGLDHVVLHALARSYILFPPSGLALPVLEDLAATVARTVSDGFALGVWLAFPVLVAGLLLNLGLGLANRFMPQLQVYFVSIPLAILLVLALLGAGLPFLLRSLAEGLLVTLARVGGAG